MIYRTTINKRKKDGSFILFRANIKDNALTTSSYCPSPFHNTL